MIKLACGVLVGAVVASGCAQAFPIAPRVQLPANDIIEVRGGCGLGWHRGPWGVCRPNGAIHVAGPYAYAPPPYVRCWWRPTPWGPRRVCAW